MRHYIKQLNFNLKILEVIFCLSLQYSSTLLRGKDKINLDMYMGRYY